MAPETRTTDAKARVSLPKAFANATVIIEHISDTEVRIRKAIIVPEGDVHFYEGSNISLSDLDRDLFLKLLDDPPEPTDALRRGLKRHKVIHE